MILDAAVLSSLQSCPRKFLLEADWEVLHWRAKTLFDACLRKGIINISNGAHPHAAADDAKAEFVQVAANPGLDLPRGSDSYKIAKDWCAMLDTVLRAAARWGLPKLSDSPVVWLNSTTEWRSLASIDTEGELHRIITVDRWDDIALSRELHSWAVFGDISVTSRPMTIHVIEIGQVRHGRRASPWARGWRHPSMPNLKMHFARKDGTTFKGWVPVYFTDSRDTDADAWVGLMYAEGVGESLVHTVPVSVPDETVRADTLRQILQESARAAVLLSERGSGGWLAQPMHRAACDGMVPCAWQSACHQMVTDPATTGLYQIKGRSMLRVA